METLAQAKEWAERYPDQVTIWREVRYFANVNGTRYALFHDWTLQELEEKIWKGEDNAG